VMRVDNPSSLIFLMAYIQFTLIT